MKETLRAEGEGATAKHWLGSRNPGGRKFLRLDLRRCSCSEMRNENINKKENNPSRALADIFCKSFPYNLASPNPVLGKHRGP